MIKKKKELHVVFHLYFFISLIIKFQHGIKAIVLEAGPVLIFLRPEAK